jgi:Do/DeqQ family serine protease
MTDNMKKIIIVALVSIVSSVSTVLLYNHFVETPQKVIIKESNPAQYANFLPPSQLPKELYYSAAPTDFVEAANVVTPTVVYIKSIVKKGGSLDDFWKMGQGGVATGSGVIISSDGYIVTNHHVIDGSSEIEVTLDDKRSFEAELIGSDPSTDLALLKIDLDNIAFLPLANSDSVRVGEWVLAVGNPFNLTSTVTAGIVSAKGRNINILEGAYKIESFIQTDAAVNPGNSGGALVNTNGQLVGINTAIITQTGHYEGYSFAIPANLVRKVITDIKDFGIVQRGFLGVVIEDVDQDIADRLSLATLEGIHIVEINEGSAASDAGLKSGDVITHINNINVKTMPSLQEQVARYRPGDKIDIGFLRNNDKKSVKLTLKNKSNSTNLAKAVDVKLLNKLGLEIREINEEEATELKVKGVKVLSIRKGSKIDRTNMDPGFVITKVNDTMVTSIEELTKAIEKSDEKVMLEGVYEDYPGEYYYAFAK